MTRRTPPVNPHGLRASGDRWLFGYADIVTLLLACFASLYATRLAPAAAAVPAVTVPAVTVPAPTVVAPGPVDAPAEESVEDSEPLVETAADSTPGSGSPLDTAFSDIVGDADALPGVEMTTSARGLVISLPEAGSFPPGRADLSPQAMRVMTDLAARLRELPNLVRVEGHTDDVPIATAQFGSNWDLSTARATRVVEFLIEQGRIDPLRLAAAGYAEHRPRVPNTTPAQRARNRRVDIVVLDPVTAVVEEPGSAPR